jgi:hypothetical protein
MYLPAGYSDEEDNDNQYDDDYDEVLKPQLFTNIFTQMIPFLHNEA